MPTLLTRMSIRPQRDFAPRRSWRRKSALLRENVGLKKPAARPPSASNHGQRFPRRSPRRRSTQRTLGAFACETAAPWPGHCRWFSPADCPAPVMMANLPWQTANSCQKPLQNRDRASGLRQAARQKTIEQASRPGLYWPAVKHHVPCIWRCSKWPPTSSAQNRFGDELLRDADRPPPAAAPHRARSTRVRSAPSLIPRDLVIGQAGRAGRSGNMLGPLIAGAATGSRVRQDDDLALTAAARCFFLLRM